MRKGTWKRGNENSVIMAFNCYWSYHNNKKQMDIFISRI